MVNMVKMIPIFFNGLSTLYYSEEELYWIVCFKNYRQLCEFVKSCYNSNIEGFISNVTFRLLLLSSAGRTRGI